MSRANQPAELFKFKQGAEVWTFSGSSFDIVFLSEVYIADTVKRSSITKGSDPFKSNVDVSFSMDNTFASQFLGFTPDIGTTLDIYVVDTEEPDTDYAITWKGRVMDASTTGGVISLVCEPIHTSMQTVGLRARYERGCRHLLYSRGCGVEMENYSRSANVVNMTSIDELTLDITASDGYYSAGMVELENGAIRYITSQVGQVVKLARPFHADNLAVGDTVEIYPGCDQTKSTCDSKFGNILNFGGWSYIPTTNPFEGNPF